MSTIQKILNWSPLLSVRRNHALEHATLHLLAQKQPQLRLAGYSDRRGFWVAGQVSTDLLSAAVNEALQRLRSGEVGLAVHPNCGTNLVVSGAAAGGLAWLVSATAGKGFKKKFDRLPWAVLLAAFGLMIAQPLGPLAQKWITTAADPGGLTISEITFYPRNGLPYHRVRTRQASES